MRRRELVGPEGGPLSPLETYELEQVSDTTEFAGRAGAAEVDTGDVRRAFDVYFDVNNDAGDIVVEVSTEADFFPAREWLRVPGGDIAPGGEQAFAVQADESSYQYVRAYAGNGYGDADVNTVEVVSSGI